MSKFSAFIFFCIMQACNSIVAMELAENQKNIHHTAQFFIQKFPHMTFDKAKNVFYGLQKPVQAAIWDKLNQNKNNKELSIALYLAHLPQELQTLILTGTDTKSKKLQEKLAQKTILELFTRKVEVDQQCGDKDLLDITIIYSGGDDYHGGYWENKKTISLTKPELLSITNHHIELFTKQRRACFPKKNLIFLTEISDDLFKKLITPHKIQFRYREGTLTIGQKSMTMAKDAFNSCKEFMPYIALPLLYSHFFINPTWDSITGNQDPLLLEQNIKFKAANKIIDNLKKLNIDGSEHLIQHIINEVPFTYSWSDWGNLAKPLLPKALMYQSFIIINDDNPFRKDLSIWWKFNQYYFLYIPSLLLAIVTSPFLYYLSNDCSTKEILGLLAAFICTTSLAGIIKGRIDSYTWKEHSIDFEKGESVAQFLNDPRIEIKENLNE